MDLILFNHQLPASNLIILNFLDYLKAVQGTVVFALVLQCVTVVTFVAMALKQRMVMDILTVISSLSGNIYLLYRNLHKRH